MSVGSCAIALPGAFTMREYGSTPVTSPACHSMTLCRPAPRSTKIATCPVSTMWRPTTGAPAADTTPPTSRCQRDPCAASHASSSRGAAPTVWCAASRSTRSVPVTGALPDGLIWNGKWILPHRDGPGAARVPCRPRRWQTCHLVPGGRRALPSAAVSLRSRRSRSLVTVLALAILGITGAASAPGQRGQSQVQTPRPPEVFPRSRVAEPAPTSRKLEAAVKLVKLDSCDPAVLARPPRTPKDMLEAAEWAQIRADLSDYHAMIDAYADGDAAGSIEAVLALSQQRLARDWTGLTRALYSINTRGIDPRAPWDARRYALAVMLHTDAALRIAGDTYGDEAFVQFQVAADLLQLGVRCAPGRFTSLAPRWYVALSRLLRDRTVLGAAVALLELGRTRLENEPAIFGESGVLAESVATIYALSQPEARTSWAAGDDRLFLRRVTDRRQAWLNDAGELAAGRTRRRTGPAPRCRRVRRDTERHGHAAARVPGGLHVRDPGAPRERRGRGIQGVVRRAAGQRIRRQRPVGRGQRRAPGRVRANRGGVQEPVRDHLRAARRRGRRLAPAARHAQGSTRPGDGPAWGTCADARANRPSAALEQRGTGT